jgi:hypothetical protein
VDAQAGTPQDRDQAAQPTAVWTVAGGAHDGDDRLDPGWIGGIPDTLVALRPAGVESRHRRRWPASTGAIEQLLGHSPSSGS